MKVLQLCHKMPVPPLDGGSQVMHFTTLALLGKKIDVKVLAMNPTRNYIDESTLPESYIRSASFESVTVDTRIKPLAFFLNLFQQESYLSKRFESKEFERKLKSILVSETFDIIQLEHLYLCKFIPIIRRISNAKIVLRPQNVEYIIWERYLKNISNPFKKWILGIATRRLKKFEQRIPDLVDGILPLTPEDAKLFFEFNRNIPLHVLPMGYDYSRLKEYDFEKQFTVPPIVYHLGSMDWLPNEEAVSWFLDEVLPLVVKAKPEVHFVFAGRKMPTWIYEYQTMNIQVFDQIDDPLEFQADKVIMIVPLLSGSGIRAKIIEGLALGKTIISTSVGAQGIDFTDNLNLLIADTPEEFSHQIIRCVNSMELCQEIGNNARSLSLKLYNNDAIALKMIQFYNQLLNRKDK